jgi:uncharacterized protein (TIGR03437 family)
MKASHHLLIYCLLAHVAGVTPAWTQAAGPVVVGSGNRAPVPLRVAPGELTTIFVQGTGAGLTEPILAAGLPLPSELAGISVELTQSESPQGPIPVPLLAVFPVSTCLEPGAAGCGKLTAINLQIPFELVPFRNIGPIQQTNRAKLVVSEQGVKGPSVELIPITDRIRISRVGDTLSGLSQTNLDPSPLTELFPLEPVVTHLDGTLVTHTKPALPGESVVLYGVGIGPVQPAVRSGEPSPQPPAEAVVVIRFDWAPDAGPSLARGLEPLAAAASASVAGNRGSGVPATTSASQAKAYLTPGFVGLYQISITIPEPPSDYRSTCRTAFRSNLTISIGRLYSFDGAGICVELPAF